MGDYESGYDPKYGYNRNAFAHKTIPTAILGKIVKIIATPIGLASEAIHANKDKKNRPSEKDSQATAATTTTTQRPSSEALTTATESQNDGQEPVYVDLPQDQADELIANGHAVPVEGQEATHELVAEDDKDDDDIQGDEADWVLDEAAEAEEPQPPPYDENDREETVENLISSIRPARGSVAPSKMAPAKLPFPVVLPQRRPGTKTRGFVRAYAPVLQESGIDQEMFISFLKSFHKAMQANPIFDVVMVATAIAGAYPDPIVGLAIQAVQVAVGIGQEIQERWRLNKFLDQANKEIFIPRGLFALIVTYKPVIGDQPEVGSETVDLGAMAMTKYGDKLLKPETADAEEDSPEKKKKMDDMKEKMKQLRIASGVTHGEAQMPVTCAPLVFPALDAVVDAASTKSGGQKDGVADSIKAKTKGSTKFVNDYLDRRAQATYAINNPNSTLTTQVAPVAPQFRSRYADPNNATNMHLFSLLTGGRWKAQPLGARRRYERAQRKEAEKRAQGIRTQPQKRMLSESVLYLMVVNMPTEQELEKAKTELQEAKERKAAAKKAAQ